MADRTLGRDEAGDNRDRARTLTNADVEAITERFMEKLFEGFGFDISTPAGRLEASGAFRMMLFWYRFSGRAAQVGIGAAITLAVAYILHKWFGIGSGP